jgi:hypothetical protein
MTHTIEQTADAILSLINSKPRSPTKDEIAAVLKPLATPAPEVRAPKHRAEWDAFMAACQTMEDTATDVELATATVCDRLNDCAERILLEPVHSPGDLLLLSEAAYWMLWCDPYGLTGPDADEQLAGGPCNDGDLPSAAVVAILRAIRDLCSQPTEQGWGNVPVPLAPANIRRANYLASDWNHIVNAFKIEKPENINDETADMLDNRAPRTRPAIVFLDSTRSTLFS